MSEFPTDPEYLLYYGRLEGANWSEDEIVAILVENGCSTQGAGGIFSELSHVADLSLAQDHCVRQLITTIAAARYEREGLQR